LSVLFQCPDKATVLCEMVRIGVDMGKRMTEVTNLETMVGCAGVKARSRSNKIKT
jgi:hypothetical protein